MTRDDPKKVLEGIITQSQRRTGLAERALAAVEARSTSGPLLVIDLAHDMHFGKYDDARRHLKLNAAIARGREADPVLFTPEIAEG